MEIAKLDEKVRAALLDGLEQAHLSPVPLPLSARRKSDGAALFVGAAKATAAAREVALEQGLVEQSGGEDGYGLSEAGLALLVEERSLPAVLRRLAGSIERTGAELAGSRAALEAAEQSFAHLRRRLSQLDGRLPRELQSTPAPPEDTRRLVELALERHTRYATFPGIRIDSLFGSLCVEAPDLDRETFHRILRELRDARRIALERTSNPREFAPGILIEENGEKLGIIKLLAVP